MTWHVFIGPPDGEPLGTTDDGIPVLGNPDGAGPMVEIHGITDVHIDTDNEGDDQ